MKVNILLALALIGLISATTAPPFKLPPGLSMQNNGLRASGQGLAEEVRDGNHLE